MVGPSQSRWPNFPGCSNASQEELSHWRFVGKGQGIHWEGLDEDISIEGLLAGLPSRESQSSFKKWLESWTPKTG